MRLLTPFFLLLGGVEKHLDAASSTGLAGCYQLLLLYMLSKKKKITPSLSSSLSSGLRSSIGFRSAPTALFLSLSLLSLRSQKRSTMKGRQQRTDPIPTLSDACHDVHSVELEQPEGGLRFARGARSGRWLLVHSLHWRGRWTLQDLQGDDPLRVGTILKYSSRGIA